MVDFTDESKFEPVHMLATGESVKGGVGGPVNVPFQQLVNRTKFLQEAIAAISATGSGIKVLGTLNSQEELDAIPTAGLAAGTAYFMNAHLYVWNTTEWVDSNSLLGPKGITFLAKWPDNNDLPDPSFNVVGDAYVWQGDIWLLLPAPDNWIKIGTPGAPGMDIYELAVKNGFVGSEYDYLESLHGKGAYQSAIDSGQFTGTEAEWAASLIGKSAYQYAVDIQGFVGTETEWLTSLIGKSAYQEWKDKGNTGSVDDFLESLKGLSFYNEWVAEGGVGSYDEFIASMKIKGDKGDTVVGPKGDPALPFSVKGQKPDEASLPTPGVATEAWYVGSSLYVWIASDNDYLKIAGAGGLSAYEIATADGYEGTEAEWLESLIGKSAYQEWLAAGNTGNADAFLTSLRGKSAYQSAKDTGFTGTEAEWVASLQAKTLYQEWLAAGHTGTFDEFLVTMKIKGDPGDTVVGPPGAGLVILGVLANQAALSGVPAVNQAAYVLNDTGHLFIYLDSTSSWTDMGLFRGMNGLTAYELAVADGFTGTATEWLASLHGKGAYQSAVDSGQFTGTEAEWAASLIGKSAFQSAVAGGFTGTEAEWVTSLHGKGAYQSAIDSGQFIGTEAEWTASLKGKDGNNGRNVIVKGAVDTLADLPESAQEQDAYSTRDTSILYMWVSGIWISLGKFKGENGKDAFQSALDTGFVGTEAEWVKSLNGKPVDIIKILTPEDPTVPPTAGNDGKAYIDLTKQIYICLNGVWTFAGTFKGDKGDQAAPFKIRDTVADIGHLPAESVAVEGDAYFTADDKMLWVFTDGQYSGPFDITGLQGKQGIQGPEGPAGKAIGILGSYPTLADLQAAHPTGNLGDGYLIGDNLAIWTTANGGQWIDIGLVRGPQGIPGPEGPAGTKPGPKGDPGNRWLTLPAGMAEPTAGYTGNAGDWAVSDQFDVFYKTVNQGWVYYGQLTAGNVNSPLPSLGKVIRQGTSWIALPVDEVPAMVVGKRYARQLKAGSQTNQGEWVEISSVVTFDTYTVKQVASTTEIDCAKGQVHTIANSSARTLTIVNPPAAGRSQILELIINGAGVITYPANVYWHGGTIPVLGVTTTVLVLTWDGTSRWLGSRGCTF